MARPKRNQKRSALARTLALLAGPHEPRRVFFSPSKTHILRYTNYYPTVLSIVRPRAVMAKKVYFTPIFSSPKHRRCNWNVAPSMSHVHQCEVISRHGERGEVSADSLTFPFLQGLVSSHPLFLSGASLPSFGAGRKKVGTAVPKHS